MPVSALPTHVVLTATDCRLSKASVVMLERIRTLDKIRLYEYIGHIGEAKMNEINTALRISIGLA